MNWHSKAIIKADEIRYKLELDIFQPINVLDACIKLRLDVRFVDISSMEGLYIRNERGKNSTIILSAHRPLPRRYFTCAHELGHHVFNHGSKLDALSERKSSSVSPPKDMDEELVDSFAGALLMPLAGVQSEFVKRKWVIPNASPIHFYTVSSIFGVGYETLIVHCKINRLISDLKAAELLKIKPAKILESLLSLPISDKSYFKLIDNLSLLQVIDLEVTNYIILPSEVQVEGVHLQKCQVTKNGENLFVAKKPGIVRAISKENNTSCFIRIQNLNYIGLVQYRHLETE
ncbi:ImmA/IrrE family metallo-endopeptidase [Runella zeae]|uniref:ImmA/IrrE family metallo-endopeptidase n=1 Tax=Runella zeae TaxID=94255 RepID=UPI002354CA81|nr:ImmA/IrrE family metallo-endopeptidase [Runella zeae]